MALFGVCASILICEKAILGMALFGVCASILICEKAIAKGLGQEITP